jgi:hypothetical protein
LQSVTQSQFNAWEFTDLSDENPLLEFLIEQCYQHMRNSPTTDQQKHWFGRMAHYVAKRTPETIRRMEAEKGLA